MEHIKRGTPVKREKETAQNHFVSLILCTKKLGWSGMRHQALRGDGAVTNYLSLRIIHGAVHCIQQRHLLVQILNCLFVQLESIKSQQFKHSNEPMIVMLITVIKLITSRKRK